MAEPNKLNLKPQPIYPEPGPTAAALPERASPTNYEVGSGSEGGTHLRSSSSATQFSEQTSDAARDLAERARDKFETVAGEARERMNEMADRASAMAQDAGQRLNELRDKFSERLPEWKQQARDRFDDARVVARHTAVRADAKAKRFPVETIVAAAGAGFVLGAGMRIWRSSRGWSA